MKVKVRLFASLREAAGRTEIDVDLQPTATVEECWKELSGRVPSLAPRRSRLQAAVNRRYATFDTGLNDHDEVVFIPPVSGG
jgi:molybdopterin converting factor subunit 1